MGMQRVVVLATLVALAPAAGAAAPADRLCLQAGDRAGDAYLADPATGPVTPDGVDLTRLVVDGDRRALRVSLRLVELPEPSTGTSHAYQVSFADRDAFHLVSARIDASSPPEFRLERLPRTAGAAAPGAPRMLRGSVDRAAGRIDVVVTAADMYGAREFRREASWVVSASSLWGVSGGRARYDLIDGREVRFGPRTRC